MPGQYDVHIFKKTLADHDALSGAALLRGAAVVADRAGQMIGLQIVLDRRAGCHRAAAEQMVAAAVTGHTRLDGIVMRAVRLLAEAGERVKLAQNSHDGVTRAVACQQRGFHAGDAALYLEALLLHDLGVQCRGLLLLEHQFRIIPDLIACLCENRQLFFYELFDALVTIHHKCSPFDVLRRVPL